VTSRGLRWILLAAVAGAATSGVFSGLLHWSQAAFVGPWLVVAVLVLGWFWRASGIDVGAELRRRLLVGLIVGVGVGMLLAFTVTRQPSSPAPAGAALIGTELWLGVVYGAVDAVMLTVIPVLSFYSSRATTEIEETRGRAPRAVAAFAASLFVTAAYHLGFREFQGPGLVQPLIGNGVMTLAYLASGSPIAAIVSHVIMHVAAVIHGAATVTQLPPHY